jgi:hypothetical protein
LAESALRFRVEALLPRARGGGRLKMGLVRLAEDTWLQPDPDLALRRATFDDHPDAVQALPQAAAPAEELARLLGISGGLAQAARATWEDMCLLTRADGEDIYRLVGAAVAFPTDWHPAQKLGLPLAALHSPIHGYREQLASGVDRFMAQLEPGPIFGRCNWFIAPTPALRWIADTPPDRAFAHVTPDNAGETLFVRCERQTLRRLPETGAILFTIGVHLAPLGTLPPAQLGWLAGALATLPGPEAERRGTGHYAPALQAYAAGRTGVRISG